MRTQSDKNNVRLLMFCDPDIPHKIMMDSGRMRQILLNLLSNAIKFSRRDSGTDFGVVDIHADLIHTGWLRVTVKENGIGMSAATVAKLFDPFTQSESDTNRQIGGTGLGMTITNHLVGEMGGRISVDSTPELGSVFRVYLPIEPIAGAKADPLLEGIEVLGLFQSPRIADNLPRYIEKAGGRFLTLNDQAALEEKLSTGTGDCIVLIQLQGSTEQSQLVDELIQKFPKIKILTLTGSRSVKSGWMSANSYVVRCHPISPSELIEGFVDVAGRKMPEVEVNTALLPSVIAAKEGGKILVVEDNEINREVLYRQLDRLGYNVDLAEEGETGFRMWQRGDYAVVLTDCHMPVTDGFELTRMIREAEDDAPQGRARTPIIAITANALAGEADRCIAAGMDDYLSKPVILKDLSAKLQKWFGALAKAAE